MKSWTSLSALGLAIGSLMTLPGHAQQLERARAGASGPPRAAIAVEPPPVTQLIVKYKEDAADQAKASFAEESAAKSHARAASISSRTGVSLKFHRAMSGRSEVLALPTKMSVAAAQALAAQIALDRSVEYAEPDYVMESTAPPPNDYHWPYQWSLSGAFSGSLIPSYVVQPIQVHPLASIDVLSAWNWSLGSRVVVGVVDTGVTAHGDLSPNLLPGYNFVSDPSNSPDGLGRGPGGWDPGTFGVCNGVSKNSSWHGTHVAGIIAAVANDAYGIAGVAPQARLISARALGTCGVGNTTDVVDAMRWLAGLPVSGVPSNPYPAKVINLSLGAETPCSSTYRRAISDVQMAGAVVVVSSGNDSTLTTTPPIRSPAACPGVIAVGSHNAEGDMTVYSSVGAEVSVTAPGGGFGVRRAGVGGFVQVGSGVRIKSDFNFGTTTPTTAAVEWLQGTSMAAPHVSGAAALLISRYPSLSPSRVKAALQQGANLWPSYSWCWVGDECGAGMLDIGNSMALASLPSASLVAAVLPASRSVVVGQTATAFATVINTGSSTAYGCQLVSPPGLDADFFYQATDPATNQVLPGFKNFPINISPGQFGSFLLALTPRATFAAQDISFQFNCATADDAPIFLGLNTLLVSSSATPVPDIVALAATVGGDGIVNVPGVAGTGFFAVATANVGASSSITASASSGSRSLPAVLSICETNPATGSCLAPPAASVSTSINAGATPTFAIFAKGSGSIPFDPANNRVFVVFRDGGGQVRGATSVAIRTQ